MHAGARSRPRREPMFEDTDDPRLWAFLGEFPAAGLALGSLIGERRGDDAVAPPTGATRALDDSPPAEA